MTDYLEEEEDSTVVATNKSFTLTEYPDKELIKTIFRHPDIWDADRMRIRKYCVLANKGKIKITYTKKSKYGRYYPEDGSVLSATGMWRRIRASLFADTEYDIDIKSAHLQILINDTKDKLPLEHLQELIDNRDEFFISFGIDYEAIRRYNKKYDMDCDKKDMIKKLLTRILNGGLQKNWEAEFELEEGDVVYPEWYFDVRDDIQSGTNMLMKDKELLFKDIKLDCLTDVKAEWDKQQMEICSKDKRKKPKEFNPEDHSVSKCKLLARYFQNREADIIDKAYDWIKQTYKIKPTAYCYDGFQYRKKDIAEPESFISRLNNEFDVEFIIKPFSDKLSPVPEYKDAIYFDVKEFNSIPNVDGLIEAYFEKYYFKIHSLGGMCYIDEAGSLIKIKNDLSHYAKIKEFWETYMWSQRLTEYFSFGNFPDKSKCPEKTYNTWVGFDVEHIKSKEDADIGRILYHFEVVANFNPEVYEYLLNYFAWLFQNPSRKTNVCLLIQGKQGTGKTTLVENLLRKMMGRRYIYDTPDIDSVVGRFNSAIAGKFMVVLNEATGKDTYGVIDKIKDSITRTEVGIEYKGVDKIMVQDYCNYCYTTNNVKPIAITEDDRRFQVIECSDKHKKDVEYFNKLYDAIDDDDVIRTFYKYLLKRDIKKFNPERDRVKTEATEDLHTLNKDPVDLFLEYAYTPEFTAYKRVYPTLEIYNEFKNYMSMINYKSYCNYITFCKILKNYSNKYGYVISKPKNVSTIEFTSKDWEVSCGIESDDDD